MYASKLANGSVVLTADPIIDAREAFEFDEKQLPSPPTEEDYILIIDFANRSFRLVRATTAEPKDLEELQESINILLGGRDDELDSIIGTGTEAPASSS